MLVLCDTDTLSEIIKSIDVHVVRRADAYIDKYGTLTFTSATVAEILYGLYRKRATVQVKSAEIAFEAYEEIVPNGNDYRLVARIMAELDRRGTPIGNIDPLIAACVINRNLGVATGNTRHFGYIVAAGFPLRLEDWRQP